MVKNFCLFVLCLAFGRAAFGQLDPRFIVITDEPTVEYSGYTVIRISPFPVWGGLKEYADRTGVRVGQFPALVDESSKQWTAILRGDVAGAEVELAARAALLADEAEQALQDSKSDARKALENEWFDVVDAIADEAGEARPSEADAKDLSKVRASLKKVKDSKDVAAGAGTRAKADDLLALSELRAELIMIDSELNTLDPGWRKSAKRHELDKQRRADF